MRSLVYTCSYHSTNDLDFLELPCFLEFFRRSLRKLSLDGNVSLKIVWCVYSHKSLCVRIKFSPMPSSEFKVAVTRRHLTQYDVTFATGDEVHVAFCSC